MGRVVDGAVERVLEDVASALRLLDEVVELADLRADGRSPVRPRFESGGDRGEWDPRRWANLM